MLTRKMMCLLQLKDKHDETKNDTAIVVCNVIGIRHEKLKTTALVMKTYENNGTTTHTDKVGTKL